MERSLKEILEIMCAPKPTDEPQESDFIHKNAEDERVDEFFIKSWLAKEAK